MKKPVFLPVGQTALPLPPFICLRSFALRSFAFGSNDNGSIGKGNAFCPTMKMGLEIETAKTSSNFVAQRSLLS